MNLKLEFIRQGLRWLAIYLASVGLPKEYVALIGDPATVNLAAAIFSYGVAEIGWVWAKLKQFVKWIKTR